MKFWARLALLVLTGSPLIGAVDLALSTQPAGSVTLWNGHDLAGWDMVLRDPKADASQAWSASDSVLHLAGKPVGYIRTEKVFFNYHLHAEWRWPAKAGNSGLLVHVRGADKVWPKSVQCQIKDPNSGDLLGMSGFDFSPSVPLKGNNVAAKLAAPCEKPAGEWNVYEVFCRDGSIEVFLNGVRQNYVTKLSAASGSVGLQFEGFPIDFRNVWLEPLPSQSK